MTGNRFSAVLRDAQARQSLAWGRQPPVRRNGSRITMPATSLAPAAAPARLVPLEVLLPDEVAEARKLRRLGWSFGGLAKRYGCKPEDVAAALGESMPGGVF